MEADDVDLPLHLPAESLGETVTITVRREDGAVDTFYVQRRELPQTGRSIWTAGPGCASARLPIRSAGWVSRDRRACGAAEATTRYIVAPGAGVDAPGTGARRARGGHCDQPLRIALGAQLGLRRFSRSAGA